MREKDKRKRLKQQEKKTVRAPPKKAYGDWTFEEGRRPINEQ
jgi:hypothetical protein